MHPEMHNDQQWMARALVQAERSVGLASPNPAVGCVLVLGDRVVGEGFHAYDLRDHAEVVALRQAASQARGSTAYVTLEPCTHYGRTGPCVDALLAAGVSSVVVAAEDPNPVVHGKGIARLRAAGVAVRTGVLQQPARSMNDAFARFITSGLPFVTLKVAASLDGRIASAPGGAHSWITGEAARAEVQQMRHAADALMVGVGTILADDPLLTDRTGQPRRRPLLRIVIDSSLRTPLDAQLVQSAQQDVLIFFNQASAEKQEAFLERGVELQQCGAIGTARVSLPEVLLRLGQRHITSLLLEGGAELLTSALNEKLVDKLTLFFAPRFLGPTGVPMVNSLRNLPAIGEYSLKRFGEDFALEAYLLDPWK